NVFSANGCGKTVKFTTSNGTADSTNTAAWVNLIPGQGANTSNIRDEVTAAGSGACTPAPSVGTTLNSNGGELSSAFSALEDAFRTKYNADTTTHTILNQDGTTAYSGRGWEVYVPVLESSCNADGTTQQINGALKVVGWTRFIITQMWDPSGGNPSKNDAWNST